MKRTVEEWVKRGNHDLEAAKHLLLEEDYFDVFSFIFTRQLRNI